MKSYFIGQILPVLCVMLLCFTLTSCNDSNEEINVSPFTGLTKVAEGYAYGAAIRIEVWAPEQLFAGYNTLSYAIFDSISGKPLNPLSLFVNPVMDMGIKTHSCPITQPSKTSAGLFSGHVIFTMPTTENGSWTLSVEVKASNGMTTGYAVLPIKVEAKSPSAVITFKASNESRYIIAYHFPMKPRVGMNPVEFIIYQNNGHDFHPAKNLDVTMTPEMVSMDHGSPNNEKPVHTKDGHYTGKVNFTMTGEWRLNLDLYESDGLLGTKFFDVVIR